MSGFLVFVAYLAGGIAWIGTTIVALATGQLGWAIAALVLPPLDLVIPFIIGVPALGVLAIFSFLAFAGASMISEEP